MAFSTTFFHFPRSWTQVIQFLTLIWQMSSLTLSSPLYLGLPCDLLVRGFHLNIFLTVLVSGNLCTWPNQLSLWALIGLTIFLCFISLSNSSLVLILHMWFSFVGPNILLKIAIQFVRLQNILSDPSLKTIFTSVYELPRLSDTHCVSCWCLKTFRRYLVIPCRLIIWHRTREDAGTRRLGIQMGTSWGVMRSMT